MVLGRSPEREMYLREFMVFHKRRITAVLYTTPTPSPPIYGPCSSQKNSRYANYQKTHNCLVIALPYCRPYLRCNHQSHGTRYVSSHPRYRKASEECLLLVDSRLAWSVFNGNTLDPGDRAHHYFFPFPFFAPGWLGLSNLKVPPAQMVLAPTSASQHGR